MCWTNHAYTSISLPRYSRMHKHNIYWHTTHALIAKILGCHTTCVLLNIYFDVTQFERIDADSHTVQIACTHIGLLHKLCDQRSVTNQISPHSTNSSSNKISRIRLTSAAHIARAIILVCDAQTVCAIRLSSATHNNYFGLCSTHLWPEVPHKNVSTNNGPVLMWNKHTQIMTSLQTYTIKPAAQIVRAHINTDTKIVTTHMTHVQMRM